VDNLAPLSKLVRLSLLDNPVTKKENYRLYVIHKLPALKLLDFSKVKQAERDAAAELYGGEAGASAAAAAKADGGDDTAMAEAPAPAKKAAKKAAAPAAAAANEGAKKAGPTAAQLTAITAAIANASTLAEVARLEKALQTGVVPSDLLGGDDAMQT
jgi:U2 small nuclear ribonucleoprotein A'